MTAHSGSEGRPPAADELLERWRQHFQASDYAGLTDLYHPEAFLVGSRPEVFIGRDRIREYFESLGPMTQPDVRFSDVNSRLTRPGLFRG